MMESVREREKKERERERERDWRGEEMEGERGGIQQIKRKNYGRMDRNRKRD